MKTFFRTVFGKALLFFLCMICGLTFGASVAWTAMMVDEEIFTTDKARVYEDAKRMSFADRCYNIVAEYSHEGTTKFYDETWEFIVYDKNMNVVANSYKNGKYIMPTGTFDLRESYYKLPENVLYTNSDGYRILYENTKYNDWNGKPSEDLIITGRLVGDLSSSNNVGLSMYATFIEMSYGLQYWIFAIVAGSLFLGIIFFSMLMSVSGRLPGTEEIHSSGINKIPYDILIVVCAFVCALMVIICDEASNSEMMFLIAAVSFAVIFVAMGLGMCMEMASRIKQGILFKNTLIGMMLCLIIKPFKKLWKFNKEIFQNMNILWKSILFIIVFNVIELFIMGMCWFEMDNLMIIWILSKFVTIPLAVYVILSLRRLERSGEALAEGNLSYYTDVNGLIGPLKAHGNNLNSIGAGMQLAIEERIKSERMKTELITNVSHDIKTPLTSIINYAGLISEEECNNEKIHEYSEVLIRQSDRLKRLIEDLVEASKASTGNLEVELVECDPSNFIVQVDGEYEEKLEAADLTLVVHSSEKEARIMADGRRMWRIFDNLMNNICKYAQPGTRVYLTLEINDDSAIFIFKNTSRDALDMTESELMERFVRGDKSRNTEGNGLGLSIAKSLAELQNGNLRLIIDGDLFKAILTFPRVK